MPRLLVTRILKSPILDSAAGAGLCAHFCKWRQSRRPHNRRGSDVSERVSIRQEKVCDLSLLDDAEVGGSGPVLERAWRLLLAAQ